MYADLSAAGVEAVWKGLDELPRECVPKRSADRQPLCLWNLSARCSVLCSRHVWLNGEGEV